MGGAATVHRQESIQLAIEDHDQSLRLRSGKLYRIVVRRPPQVQLFSRLYDCAGEHPLAGLEYTVEGAAGERLQGRTDARGTLQHRNLKPERYCLQLRDPGGNLRTLGLPWIGLEHTEPHLQAVPGFGVRVQVFVELRDSRGRNPLAHTPYALRVSDRLVARGLTDGLGILRQRGLAAGRYELLINDVAGKEHVVGVPWLSESRKQPHLQVVPGLHTGAAQILAQLFDTSSRRPLAGISCQLQGPDGRTTPCVATSQGLVRLRDVPALPHRLHVRTPAGQERIVGLTPVPSRCAQPLLVQLDYGLPQRQRVCAQLFARDGLKPLAGLSYSLCAAGSEVRSGRTDGQGILRESGLEAVPHQLQLRGPQGALKPFGVPWSQGGAPHLCIGSDMAPNGGTQR